MSSLSDHQKGLLAVLTAAILWSAGGLFIKLVSFTAMPVNFFRGAFAAVVIAAIYRKKAFTITKTVLINAFFYTATLIAYVISMKTTTAANAIFLQYTAPVYVFIFEPILMKTKFESMNLVAILVCLAGMGLFFMGDLAPGHFEGNILALLSGISFAALILGLRKQKADQAATLFWGNSFIAVICLPWLFEVSSFPIDDMLMVAFLGTTQIGLSYVIFTWGIRRVLAIESSLITMVEPVLNPLWVYLGYGEVPTSYAIAGGVIIIITLLVRSLYAEKKRKLSLQKTE